MIHFDDHILNITNGDVKTTSINLKMVKVMYMEPMGDEYPKYNTIYLDDYEYRCESRIEMVGVYSLFYNKWKRCT